MVSSARSGLPAAQAQTQAPPSTTTTVWMAQLYEISLELPEKPPKPPPASTPQIRNTAPSTRSSTFMTLALVLRARPMMPATKQMAASSSMTHAG